MKCSLCLDAALQNETPVQDVPEAAAMVAVMQAFTLNGQQIAAPVPLLVCADCRKRQLGVVSKTGLIAA